MITSRYRYYLLCVVLMMILPVFLSTCKKDPELPSGNNQFQFGTTKVDSLSYTSLKLTTTISSTGGHGITEYGHCWSIEQSPDLTDSLTKISGTPQNLKISTEIQNLEPKTKYYIRAYCKLDNGTVFSSEVQSQTLKTGKPIVLTQNIFDVTVTTAKCEGEVTSDSGLIVTERGVCWDLDEDFDISACLGKLIEGLGLGSFSCQLVNLQEGEQYFIKAYAINEAGVSYGEVKSFETSLLSLPSVITGEITLVTTNSAECAGEVESSGNGTIIQRGVCWSDSENPTLANCLGYTSEGQGIGSFTSSLTGLLDGAFYYVIAYATNEKGTGYGEEKSFQTVSINLPTVVTSSVTNVTSTSAQCGGNVINTGNGIVTARGCCWGFTSDVSLENCVNYTANGNGGGSFVSYLTGLTSGIIYYIRAYATNQKGTSYGGLNSFTPSDPPCGQLTVIYGGMIYNTIKIGDQCWLKQSLNIGTMINGFVNQSNNQVIEKYCYNNSEANCSTYGGLYQWNEAMGYVSSQETQGICPEGWHIPSDAEWKILEGSVDSQYGVGDPIWDQSTFRGFDSGLKLKSTYGWKDNGNGIDDYSFTIQPGGYLYIDQTFIYYTERAIFWTSTEGDSQNALIRQFRYSEDNSGRYTPDKSHGFSIRCVKD